MCKSVKYFIIINLVDKYYGIILESHCDNNTISGNPANYNGEAIVLFGSHYNNITGNTVNHNSNYGIYMSEALNNTIKGKKVSNNDYGMYIEEDGDYNEISENIIYNNTIGLTIDDIGGINDNNTIYGNFFLINGIHAVNNGTDNKWNSMTIGNYWDNHTGPDTTPQDGIVDAPYTFIGGSAGSIDFLSIAEDGAPSITINSPTPSDVFAVSAPSFNVYITDDNLDTMWYTIDGGLTNYTFTANGTIDQTAWTALSQGNVTITFYARDFAGHETSESVAVIKSIPLGGIDPIIVIVIVVVSIVGGVVALAVVYIFLKKRASPTPE